MSLAIRKLIAEVTAENTHRLDEAQPHLDSFYRYFRAGLVEFDAGNPAMANAYFRLGKLNFEALIKSLP